MEDVTLEELDKVNAVPAGAGVSLIGDEQALLSKVDVELTIVFGSARIPLSRLLSLAAGDVVELEQTVNHPVSIEYDGATVANGVLVAADGKLGVKVLGVQAG